MSEMIDKVETAIFEAVGSSIPLEMCRKAAIAAITSMREPNKAMYYAGDAYYESERDGIMGPAPIPMWRAMIDAALK